MYSKIMVFVILLAVLLLTSPIVNAQLTQLFGCNPTARYSDLLIINKSSAATEAVVAVDCLNLSALAFHSDGTLYSSTSKSNNGDIVILDAATGAISSLKPDAIGEDFSRLSSLAFNAGGTLYGSANNGVFGVLVRINTTTGAAQKIGAHGGYFPDPMTGLAFAGSTLYGVRYVIEDPIPEPQNYLYTINTGTGSAANKTLLSGVVGALQGLASDGGDPATLYGCDDLGYLYTITTSGVCTLVGQALADKLSGLSFHPNPITPGEGNISCTTEGPPVWSYSLEHVGGSIREWRLSANEITGASAPVGWQVFDQTLTQVIFHKDEPPLTSGVVSGFEVLGNDGYPAASWQVHSSSGMVPGPTYSLPFEISGAELFFPDHETPATGSPMPLGFDFTFFGVSYDRVYINPNGHLTFGAAPSGCTVVEEGDCLNQPFPFADGIPRIAPFWDDLDPSDTGGGLVTYNADTANQVFIVSYLSVPLWSSPAITNTCQVILFGSDNSYAKPGGSIAFGYSVLNGVAGSATIGLNGGAGDYALIPEVGANGITTAEELGEYCLGNKNFLFTPAGATYTTCEMGDDRSEYRGLVQLDGSPPTGMPGAPKTWHYQLTCQSGQLNQWLYLGSEITAAEVTGAAASAGWSVVEQSDTRVIFATDQPLLPGQLSGFNLSGNSTDSNGEWIMHGKSDQIPGPQLSLPIDPNRSGTVLLDLELRSYSDFLPLGFAFPFFGVNQTGLYVSSNGNLWFNEDTNGDALNQELGVADGIGRIAAFWDWFKTGTGEISYYKDPTAGLFVVTYVSVKVIVGNLNTFQIILFGPNNPYGFQNGTIALCYGPLNGVSDTATIGLNKGDGEYAAIGPPKTTSTGLVWDSHLPGLQNRNFIFHWNTEIAQYEVEETFDDRLLFYGDVSGDFNITAFDAALILQVSAGILQLNDPGYPYLTLERADVTANGTVSGLDAALVLQYSVGLITDFPKSSTGAPALKTKIEAKLLAEAVKRLESVSLSREGQRVLESLKHLIAKSQSPSSTGLFQNFPNPFNPETWIPYDLSSPALVQLSIFDIKGALVRHLDLGMKAAGLYRTKNLAAYWNGRNSKGEKVASGIYFYTLQAGNFTQIRRMVLLK